MSDPVSEDRLAYLAALCRTVPFNLVERVLDDPREHSVQGQAVEGAILHADVVGFTALCERLASSGSEGLSRLSEILDALFSELLEVAIRRYGGYVVNFGGDSVTAVFRGEEADLRCVAAALAAQRTMYGEAGRLLGGKSRDLQLRVGLSRGRIHLPVLGDLHRRSVVTAGPTAHRVVKWEGEADPGTVLADASFAEILSGNAEIVERKEDTCVIRGLRKWPATAPLKPAKVSVLAENVEDRIGLLEPFVAAPLAVRLRTTPDGWRLAGELREVVVVFVEVWGMDSAMVSAESERVAVNIGRSFLRAYRKYGGLVAKADLTPKGHRLMVIFGLHRPGENDAERALLAAIESTRRLRSFILDTPLEVGLRTGIHSGRVYFGAIGSDNRHDITVVGDAVNVAARISNAADTYEILASQPILDSVGEEFETEARGRTPMKGRSSGVALYAVKGARQSSARHAKARREERFLAGRDLERNQLRDAVERALGGQGSIMSLVGDAGIGKTTMLTEAIDRWVAGGGSAVVARCRYAGRSQPLEPAMAMFANFLGLGSTDSEADRRDLIRRGFSHYRLEGGAPELMSLLQPVMRPDGTTEALVDLADSHARERVLSSIIEFLNKRLDEQAMLYVTEDLHLADTLTLELAQRMSALSRKRPFLVIGTYRPDPVLKDLRRIMDEEIELKGLNLKETTKLIAHTVGCRDVDSELAVFLWERAKGNPGSVLDIVTFLRERQLINVRADTAHAPSPGITMLDNVVPKQLAHVALTRIDQLGSVPRRVLRIASAIGRRFNRGILEQAVTGELSEIKLADALDILEGARVILSNPQDPDGYMFCDGVTRAVTYSSVPQPERRDIHKRIADALERFEEDDRRRIAANIARHRDQAQQWGDAVTWYRRAARGAVRSGLNAEAVDLFDRYETVLRKVDAKQRPNKRKQARLALLHLVATGRLGDATNTLSVSRKVSAEFWDVLQGTESMLVEYWLGRSLLALGRPEKAREHLERVVESEASDAQRSDAARYIAASHRQSHDLDACEEWLRKARGLAGADKHRMMRIALERGLCSMARGDLADARKRFEKVKSSTHKSEHLTLASDATAHLAMCDLLDAKLEDAREGFDDARVMYRALRNFGSEARMLIHRGESWLWQGNASGAVELLRRGLRLAKEVGEEAAASQAMVHLGAALSVTGDEDEGSKLLKDGYKRVMRAGVRQAEVAADLHFLRVAVEQGDKSAIDGAIKRCEAQREHLTSVPLFRKVFGELSAQ